MPEIPECLNRRYKALDELIRELSLMSQCSDPENIDPGIKLMCNFWNILKDDPACNLTEEVQQFFPSPSDESSIYSGIPAQQTHSFMGPTRLQCYMACNTGPEPSGSSCGPQKCTSGTGRGEGATPPLTKVLTNLKQAASFDNSCNKKLRELLTAEKYLKTQIAHLEQKEKEGVSLMKEADNMWAGMEDAYKEKIAESLERQNELMKQLHDIEKSAAKWRKNKKDLEAQLDSINKCQVQMIEKINQKSNDLKSIQTEIVSYKKRIENTKKEQESIKKVIVNKKQASDGRIAKIAQEISRLEQELREATKQKQDKENAGKTYIAEARNELQEVCKVVLQRRLEHEDLKAEKLALIAEINMLKDSCDTCKARCAKKQTTISEELKKVDIEIANYRLKCVKCNVSVDTNDARTLCSDCPRCQEHRQCLIDGQICKSDIAEECVCSKVKQMFLNNVFDNMYTVMEKKVQTKAGKALGTEILSCLKKSRNGKLNANTRRLLQEFVLQTVKKNLNLTIVGGAVKTRCELDTPTYKQLMLCLKTVKAVPPPKSDKGTDVKKDPCGRWGGETECNCPKGPKNCICTRKAPPPPKDPATCPPEPPDDPGQQVVCPHKSKPCGPECGAHLVDRVGASVAKFRPDPCSGQSCPFGTNMRAAQCVLGPESLTTESPCPRCPQTAPSCMSPAKSCVSPKGSKQLLAVRSKSSLKCCKTVDNTPSDTSSCNPGFQKIPSRKVEINVAKPRICYNCGAQKPFKINPSRSNSQCCLKDQTKSQYKCQQCEDEDKCQIELKCQKCRMRLKECDECDNLDIKEFLNHIIALKKPYKNVAIKDLKLLMELVKKSETKNIHQTQGNEMKGETENKQKKENKEQEENKEQKEKKNQPFKVQEDDESFRSEKQPTKEVRLQSLTSLSYAAGIPPKKRDIADNSVGIRVSPSGASTMELDEYFVNRLEGITKDNQNMYVYLTGTESGRFFIDMHPADSADKQTIARLKIERTPLHAIVFDVFDNNMDDLKSIGGAIIPSNLIKIVKRRRNSLSNLQKRAKIYFTKEQQDLKDLVHFKQKRHEISFYKEDNKSVQKGPQEKKRNHDIKDALDQNKNELQELYTKTNNDVLTINVEADNRLSAASLTGCITKTSSGNIAIDVMSLSTVSELSNLAADHPVLLSKSPSNNFKLIIGYQPDEDSKVSNATLRRTYSDRLLVVINEPILKSKIHDRTHVPCTTKNIFKIKISGETNDTILPVVLKTSPSFNYFLVIDKEFEKIYMNSLNSAIDENAECFVELHETDSTISINFEKDSNKNAALVKTPSNTIKIIVKNPAFKNIASKSKENPKKHQMILKQFKDFIDEINKKRPQVLTNKLMTNVKSMSESYLYKNKKIKNNLSLETTAKFQRTDAGQYAAVLEKGSMKSFINDLQSHLARINPQNVPIKRTDSGEITVILNPDEERQSLFGSLKITASGNLYVVVDENVLQDIKEKEKNVMLSDQLQYGSEHMIGKVKQPEDKAAATFCNAMSEDCLENFYGIKPKDKSFCNTKDCDPEKYIATVCSSDKLCSCLQKPKNVDSYYFTEALYRYEDLSLSKEIINVKKMCGKVLHDNSIKNTF